jgi:putative redox protein
VHVLGDAADDIRADGEARVTLAGRPFTLRRSFLEALDQADCDQAIAALGRPLLVFHSPQDEVVSIDNASQIFLAAGHPRSFVSLDDADHLLTDPDDARYVGHVISAWVERYL